MTETPPKSPSTKLAARMSVEMVQVVLLLTTPGDAILCFVLDFEIFRYGRDRFRKFSYCLAVYRIP